VTATTLIENCTTSPSRCRPGPKCCARDRRKPFGAKIDFEERRRAGCQIAVEFRDPDINPLEIYWGVDQVGSDGRVRPANEWHGVASLDAAFAHPVLGQDTHIPK